MYKAHDMYVYDVLAQNYKKYTKWPMYQGLEYRGQGTDRPMIYSEQPLRDLPSKIFSLVSKNTHFSLDDSFNFLI